MRRNTCSYFDEPQRRDRRRNLARADQSNRGFDGQVLALDADEETGDVYAGGDFLVYDSTTTSGRCIRLNDDGTADTEFAVGIGFDSTVHAIALANDGSGDVYVGGNFGSYQSRAASGIVRPGPDGTPNVAFMMGMGMGIVGRVRALVSDTSGTVTAGGAISAYAGTRIGGIVRIQPDGTIEPTFAAGADMGFDGEVLAMAFAPDDSGDIYVVGQFTLYDGMPAKGIARLDPTGALVASFDAGTGFGDSALAIAATEDGSSDIYVAGSFTTYDGEPVSRGIVRLHADGMRDTTFDAGAGVDTSITTIALPRDGSDQVSIGGLFATYDGESHPNIVRVLRSLAQLVHGRWERSDREHVTASDGQELHVVLRGASLDQLGQRHLELQLAQPELDRRLPDAGDAEVTLGSRFGDASPRVCRQLRGLHRQPEERVSVEEELHR